MSALLDYANSENEGEEMSAFDDWFDNKCYQAEWDREKLRLAWNAGMTRAAEICMRSDVATFSEAQADACSEAIEKARD